MNAAVAKTLALFFGLIAVGTLVWWLFARPLTVERETTLPEFISSLEKDEIASFTLSDDVIHGAYRCCKGRFRIYLHDDAKPVYDVLRKKSISITYARSTPISTVIDNLFTWSFPGVLLGLSCAYSMMWAYSMRVQRRQTDELRYAALRAGFAPPSNSTADPTTNILSVVYDPKSNVALGREAEEKLGALLAQSGITSRVLTRDLPTAYSYRPPSAGSWIPTELNLVLIVTGSLILNTIIQEIAKDLYKFFKAYFKQLKKSRSSPVSFGVIVDIQCQDSRRYHASINFDNEENMKMGLHRLHIYLKEDAPSTAKSSKPVDLTDRTGAIWPMAVKLGGVASCVLAAYVLSVHYIRASWVHVMAGVLLAAILVLVAYRAALLLIRRRRQWKYSLETAKQWIKQIDE